MMRKNWWKGAALIGLGTAFSLGLGGGCLNAVVQRILVAVAFD